MLISAHLEKKVYVFKGIYKMQLSPYFLIHYLHFMVAQLLLAENDSLMISFNKSTISKLKSSNAQGEIGRVAVDL